MSNLVKTRKTQDVSASTCDTSSSQVDGNIKNLSTVAKLAKFKKPKFIKSKKSDLVKAQNFAKTNFFEIDFLILEAKKTFIYL